MAKTQSLRDPSADRACEGGWSLRPRSPRQYLVPNSGETGGGSPLRRHDPHAAPRRVGNERRAIGLFAGTLDDAAQE